MTQLVLKKLFHYFFYSSIIWANNFDISFKLKQFVFQTETTVHSSDFSLVSLKLSLLIINPGI